MPADLAEGGDWNEEEIRAAKAAEAEEIIAEAQPGQVLDGRLAPKSLLKRATNGAANEVVLKIRRRKFQSTPQRGEIVISRRLFRTGDSEYLLNGKLCRLRDIQDIFMGTGLGPESYAIIGQERIGQLLSSKPHDRRAIIEEAAGITRFKTKKRLAELRLEQSKQNLARVNDIFEEVSKQVASLKRQAAKAERYGALRDEMRARLRVVLASKVAAMDAEQLSLAEEIAALSTEIESHAAHRSMLCKANIRLERLAAMRSTSARRKLPQRRARRRSNWSVRSRGRVRTRSASLNLIHGRQPARLSLARRSSIWMA